MSSFMAARALTRQARAQLFPTVTTNPTIVATHQPFFAGTSPSSSSTPASSASQARDIVLDERHRERNLRGVRAAVRCVVGSGFWGRLSNTVRANAYAAQASAADLRTCV